MKLNILVFEHLGNQLTVEPQGVRDSKIFEQSV